MTVRASLIFAVLLLAGCTASRVTVFPDRGVAASRLALPAPADDPFRLVRSGELDRAEQALGRMPLDSSARTRAAQGMLHYLQGRTDLAESLLRGVLDSKADSAARRLAYFGLQSMLITAENYAALETLEYRALAEGLSTDTTSRTTARALSLIGPSRVTGPGRTAILSMKPGLANCPTARVRVNGRGPFEFWFDTGASICVVSAEVARRCRVRIVTPEVGCAGTATARKVRFRFGLADSLRLGAFVVHNVPVMVMSRRDLSLGVPFLRIPGIVGLSVLSRFRLTIDNPARRIILEYPVAQTAAADRNLRFFAGIALAETRVDSSGPLSFIVDTGAGLSMLQETGLAKLVPTPGLISSPGCVGGAGGGDVGRVKFVPGTELTLGGQSAFPINLAVRKLPVAEFPLAVDGLVGEDFLKNFVVTFDLPNGRLTVSPPPARVAKPSKG
jgi:hypothetical protein